MSEKTNKEYLCTISLTRKGEGFAVSEEFKKDLFIPKEKVNGAFNGDSVWVKIDNEKFFEGKVLRIESRVKEEFVGSLHRNDQETWLIPKDTKVPTNIMIDSASAEQFKKHFVDEDIALVKIIKWPDGKSLPVAEIVRIIGKAGENNTEMEAIVAEHGFKTGHDKKIEDEAHSINKSGISEKDLQGRRDFRKITTFTIDPDDAKDFDDAISFLPLENGKFEIGVHIADVSHYVVPGTTLDNEARKRATSIYLVDRVIPMLPEILSNNLCSLLPNKDRLTFSAVFTIDIHGNISDEWYGKTIIHSDRRFTYEEVQEIIETGKGDYSEEVLTLDKIAKSLRKERFRKGSMYFDSAEIKFKMDEKGKPISVYKKVQKDSHKLVEDFMLLANKKVAEKIFNSKDKAGKIFVYRNHDLPNSDKIEDLKEVLVKFGHNVKAKGLGLNNVELNEVINKFEGMEERSLIMWIILRSMAKADYSTENIGHFSLAYESYTHFTSPIRRYPDVMVHRLLQHHLLNERVKEDKKEYEKMCRHCSDMERKAMNAERESIKFKQVEFVMDKIGQTFDGIITGITDWGMYVEAQEIFCEGMVSLRDMKDDFYSADEKGLALIGEKTKKRYKIGQKIKIEIVAANLRKRVIDFKLAE
ncbi:MAG: ribonuclease R [bacterium]